MFSTDLVQRRRYTAMYVPHDGGTSSWIIRYHVFLSRLGFVGLSLAFGCPNLITHVLISTAHINPSSLIIIVIHSRWDGASSSCRLFECARSFRNQYIGKAVASMSIDSSINRPNPPIEQSNASTPTWYVVDHRMQKSNSAGCAS